MKKRMILETVGVVVMLVATSTVSGATRPVQTGGEQPAAGVVNVNTADEVQLSMLPGVGPKTAALIIAGRPFKSLGDLDAVKGIGVKKLAAMAPYVTFEGKTTVTSKIKVAKPTPTQDRFEDPTKPHGAHISNILVDESALLHDTRAVQS